MAEMPHPLRGGDLLGDQPVTRRRVGRSQQRFGKAHEGKPLAACERVFPKEALNHTVAFTDPPRCADQFGCIGRDRSSQGTIKYRLAQQAPDDLTLVLVLESVQRVQMVELAHRSNLRPAQHERKVPPIGEHQAKLARAPSVWRSRKSCTIAEQRLRKC